MSHIILNSMDSLCLWCIFFILASFFLEVRVEKLQYQKLFFFPRSRPRQDLIIKKKKNKIIEEKNNNT